MTQLSNAFIYYGLISGYYGMRASDLLPQPNRVLPEGVMPQMEIFNPRYHSIRDYMMNLPTIDTLNLHFQTIKQTSDRKASQILKRQPKPSGTSLEQRLNQS